ncbi:MAG: hypothetical protein DMF63_16825 [Acidobacteria bacterium]|nr:MAG: hypothetical protein DMF63_16825 [Acidobacteriota bacterium]
MKAKYFCRRLSLSAIVSTLSLVLCLSTFSSAQRSEYRGFWIDNINTDFNRHTDIVGIVNRAKSAKANAIFAQVRRRGDAWYITPFEPKFGLIPAGFDPLADLITVAHSEGIEVHAFVVVGAVHQSNGAPPAMTLPTSPIHVFNQHGGFDPVSRTIVPGPNNWLTRTLLPDGLSTSFQGHRFGSDFWIDFGHPDAAAYTVNVLMHLVNNYNIDGLHLDSVRYPDFTGTVQTPATGSNVGYNPASVNRFNLHYSRIGNPAANDPQWSQWRRDQVTNIARRIYLNAIGSRPNLKVSGAFIANGDGPATEAQWNSSDAYWRVYQDWRSWTEEGIVDMAIPTTYRREHLADQAAQFQHWNEWTKNHQYNRSALIGVGNFINPIEGNLRQVRSSLLSPSTTGNSAKGVVFFSMTTSNVGATNGVTSGLILNPFAIPPSVTDIRDFSEFASSLVRGKSVNGVTRYEDPVANPIAVFADAAAIPVHPWKVAPTKGHLMGFVRRPDGTILDTANVTIQNTATGDVRTGATDGGGFYGAVDLAPGNYRVTAELGTTRLYACSAVVSAGVVTTADVNSETTGDPPTTTAAVIPDTPDGANGWYLTSPTVSLSATGGCAGLARVEYSFDKGETWITYDGPVTIEQEGITTMLFRAIDQTGTVEPAGSRTFMVDLSAPTLGLTSTPSEIWPPNGSMTPISISGTGADSGSGLAGVSYVVTDEYGTALSIEPRSLEGASANWFETLLVEARRNGNDRDGRLYTIAAVATDAAGRSSTVAQTTVRVLHDRRAK